MPRLHHWDFSKPFTLRPSQAAKREILRWKWVRWKCEFNNWVEGSLGCTEVRDSLGPLQSNPFLCIGHLNTETDRHGSPSAVWPPPFLELKKQLISRLRGSAASVRQYHMMGHQWKEWIGGTLHCLYMNDTEYWSKKYWVAESDDEDIIFSRQGKVAWCTCTVCTTLSWALPLR